MNAEEFVEDFLSHAYDPVKAREYYLRTRKLKGRKPGPKFTPSDSFRKVTRPVLKKAPKKINEDEVPEKSPSGAKIIDFDGSGSGRAIYSDGTVFDGNGWDKVTSAKDRLDVARKKLDLIKTQAAKIQDPAFKKQRLKRIAELEKQLNSSTKLVRSRRRDPRQ